MPEVSVIDVTKSLKDMEFPADKDDLVQHAQDNGAEQDLVDMLESLPDQGYDSIADVMASLTDTK